MSADVRRPAARASAGIATRAASRRLWYPPPMRFLVAGVALLGVAVGMSEYALRHPVAPAEPVARGPAALPTWLETAPAPTAPPSSLEPFAARLESAGEAPRQKGFAVVATAQCPARALQGAFGAALFLLDCDGASAIVRAATGEGARVVAAAGARITSLRVDGSTAFFSAGGTIWSIPVRGGEAPVARVHFPRARVTAFAVAGDTLYATLVDSTDGAAGAVVRVASDGVPQVIASEQAQPSGVEADAAGVFWLSGSPSALWRAPADGSFASRVVDAAEGPLALEADGLLFRTAAGALQRVARSGGEPVTLAEGPITTFVASSGLVRFVTPAALWEVVAGAPPVELFAPPDAPVGVAIVGTTLYVLAAASHGATLYAK